ncbi:cell division protein DivIVA [Psychromonas sp. MME2]|uniref:cell division protein DivIVA n=1 Tax=unclassified Psychromonas TaxID=2614957 RepID=UPI00339C9D9F
MATQWHKLHQQFLTEYAYSGISVKAWCKKEQINYATARRHIKINAQIMPPTVRTMRSDENVKTTHLPLITESNKIKNQLVNEINIDTSTHKTTDKEASAKKRVASLANQNARTFGHYSEFITTSEDAVRYASAATTKLNDELKLMRMQLSNLMVAIKMVEEELHSNASVDQKIPLHESYEKYQTAASVKVARIESLENSIIRNEKMKVDIQKTIVLTEKAQLEADKLRAESSNGNTPLQDIYNEILAMDNDGMMNNMDYCINCSAKNNNK